VKRGVKPNDMIGLYSINRPEWILAEHMCFRQGFITVPLYDSLGLEAVDHILRICEIAVVFCTADKLENLFEISKNLEVLKTVIVMDPFDEDLKARARHLQLIDFRTLELEGEKGTVPSLQITSKTIATVCFTSGTTGVPKGVVLTHGNFIAFIASTKEMMAAGEMPNFTPNEIHISYLPLAHIFERMLHTMIVYTGSRIGFYQGNTALLMDDVAELRPTVFISVPRLYNRIYDKVMGGAKSASPLKRILFNLAYNSKKKQLAKGKFTHFLWDRLVFSKVKAKLGGNLKVMISAAAPITPQIVSFLRICFCVFVMEAYGQTETTGAITITASSDFSTGTVGIPMSNCMVQN
jgi:long-chain acyl-CoA synthetase